VPPSDLGNPQRFHGYAYCGNRPLVAHDPSGKVWGLIGKVVKIAIKGGDIASTVAGAIEDTQTILSSDADVGLGDRLLAAASLASEIVSPVSVKDVRAVAKIASAGTDAKALARVGEASDAAASAAKTGEAFFEGAKYSPKVLQQMNKADDVLHAFPQSVDGFATKYGQLTTKSGADGKAYQWLEMRGSYADKTGTFEFIKDSNGVINHRYLKPD
jgi:hypothetical protein